MYSKIANYLKKFKDGSEIPNEKPIAVPAGLRRPETIQDIVRRLVRPLVDMELSQYASEAEDSIDSVTDLDEDDDEAQSPHELVHDPDLNMEITRAEKAYVDKQRAEFNGYVSHARRKHAESKEQVREKQKKKAASPPEEDPEE